MIEFDLDLDSSLQTTVGTGAEEGFDEDKAYTYLKAKGVSDTHAKGIVANIYAESSFNPEAEGDGGTSFGLFQHRADRLDNLKSFAGDRYTDPYKQIDFALTEKEAQEYLSTDFSSPEDAAKAFTIKFERPANAEQKAEERVSWLSGIEFSQREFEEVNKPKFKINPDEYFLNDSGSEGGTGEEYDLTLKDKADLFVYGLQDTWKGINQLAGNDSEEWKAEAEHIKQLQ